MDAQALGKAETTAENEQKGDDNLPEGTGDLEKAKENAQKEEEKAPEPSPINSNAIKDYENPEKAPVAIKLTDNASDEDIPQVTNIAEGVFYSHLAREWSCKWSDSDDKASLNKC